MKSQKTTWEERARQLLEEQQADRRLTNREWVRKRLGWEDWERLLGVMAQVARQEAGRRRWRGAKGGVLPEGFDAESIASEVAAAALAGRCRLAPGWSGEGLRRELGRLVKQEVRRLHKLAEASAMRSEWEVLGPGKSGELRSMVERLEGTIPDGREVAVRREEAQDWEGVKVRLEKALDGDGVARGVLECLCDGVGKRREIAARLGVDVAAVTAARKRLERRGAE